MLSYLRKLRTQIWVFCRKKVVPIILADAHSGVRRIIVAVMGAPNNARRYGGSMLTQWAATNDKQHGEED